MTFTAIVSPVAPASGTPTGTVTFYDGTTAIDTETLSGGSASYTTSTLAGGGHAITVVYGGDTNFIGSRSSAITQTVSPENMIWTNAAGGDWDTAGNWVNAANSSDHHVPTDYDNALINMSGITITHDDNTSDSVYMLTVASGTTLILSNGSLAIATDSTISGDLVPSGGSLYLAAGLSILGSTDWTGGTITGGGTITTQGTLTLGDASQNDQEFLNNATFDNAATATLAAQNSNYGLYLSDGALFDNQNGASFTLETNARINGDGTATFQNDGVLIQSAASTGTSDITSIFNQSSTGSTKVQGGNLQFDGGGTITGPLTADAGASLDFDGGTFDLDGSSTITGDGTAYFTGATVNDAGVYTVTGGTVLTSGELNFDDGQIIILPSLTMSGGTLTGFSTLIVTSSTDWTGGTITGVGTITT